MLRTLILTSAIALAFALPTSSFAAGSESESKPKKTETTQNCLKAEQWDPEIKKFVRFSQPVNGVWDADIRKCVRPDKTSHLDSDTLYKAVRELADRKSTRLNSSHLVISYAVFCLKKKKTRNTAHTIRCIK